MVDTGNAAVDMLLDAVSCTSAYVELATIKRALTVFAPAMSERLVNGDHYCKLCRKQQYTAFGGANSPLAHHLGCRGEAIIATLQKALEAHAAGTGAQA